MLFYTAFLLKRGSPMFNRQSIHIALLLWGCIFCLIAALCMYLSRDVDRAKKQIMLYMQLSCAVLLGSDAAAWAFRGEPGSFGRGMVYVSNFLVFAYSDIVLLFYHAYVCECLFGTNPMPQPAKCRIQLGYAVGAVGVGMVILSQFTGLYYTIDAQNFYHRSPAAFVSFLIPAVGMLLDLSLLMQYRKNIGHELYVAMLSYIALPLAALAVQTFYYGASLINIAISISMLLMFLETLIAQSRKAARQELQLAQIERQLAEKDRALAKTERELTDSRITSMLSQIRNHFIFNVLGTISSYCKTDPQKADEALIKFSRYLRRNMRYLETKDKVPFTTEVAQIEDYVALEQMRFGDLVEFGEDLEAIDFLLPPLTVQPLVENAIKHGLTIPGKKGTVCLSTRREPAAICICVEDDGVGFDTQKTDEAASVGIRNIRQRLQYMSDATLTIESTPGQGTKAVIRIPTKEGKL